MKKILGFFVMLVLIFSTSHADTTIYEKPDVRIIVQGSELQLEENVPIIVNSRTLVPLRKLLVGLGVPDNTTNIQWIAEDMAVKVNYNGVVIDLKIGSNDGYINGQKYTLDAAPIIHKDRTYLPARFVGEALGYTISWDPYTPAVIVTSNDQMKLLTEILNDMKTAMNNIESYEAISTEDMTMTTQYVGEREVLKTNIVELERADMVKGIVYTETQYEDDYEKSFTFEYATNDTLYSCYKYEEDGVLYNAGWNEYGYDFNSDVDTPFNLKEKIAIIKIDESLYGALLCQETDEEYILFTSSNQIDIIKDITFGGIYNEMLMGYDDVQEFNFVMTLNKETKLPTYAQVTASLKYEDTLEGELYTVVEDIDYKIVFNKYNHYLEIDLPVV